MEMSILDVRALSAGYDDGFVIRDISLTVEAGRVRRRPRPERLGKEHADQGRPEPARRTSRGEVLCGGEDVFRMGPRRIAAKIAYVPQLAEPVFEYTAGEVVLMGRFARQGRLEKVSAEDEAAVAEAMRLTEIAGFGQQAAFAAERRRATAGFHRPGPGPGHSPAPPRRAQPPPRYQLPGRDLRHPQGPPDRTRERRSSRPSTISTWPRPTPNGWSFSRTARSRPRALPRRRSRPITSARSSAPTSTSARTPGRACRRYRWPARREGHEARAL